MIILASASPRRKELLTQMGLEFEIVTSEAPEFTDQTDPGLMVEDLSRKKAEAVYSKLTAEGVLPSGDESLIIAADTLVFKDGQVLGKPQSEADAFRMLSMLQGSSHEVMTGVSLIDIKQVFGSNPLRVLYDSFHETTKVFFSPMTEGEIRRYIASGEPMDKAGAYGIQGLSAKFVNRIEGDYFNVVGLPVSALYNKLKFFGILREG